MLERQCCWTSQQGSRFLVKELSLFLFFSSISLKPCVILFQILDPIFPGQEFPLPLHLAKSGRLRWRPLGDSFLWSEAHSISKVLSQDSRIGFRRSFACYPCHPSHEPFRCCISVESSSLPASFGRELHDIDQSREQFIHQVTLSTPFVVSSCLPEPISLSIESGGITQTASLSEVCEIFPYNFLLKIELNCVFVLLLWYFLCDEKMYLFRGRLRSIILILHMTWSLSSN